MSKLFEPITIRGLRLKNRIIMLPMVLGLGLRSQKARAFYTERARGGVGAIVTSATPIDLFISDEAWERPSGVSHFLEGLRSLVNDVHEAGAKIGMQLMQPSLYYERATPPDDPEVKSQGEWVAPSARVEPTPSVHPMPDGQELRELSLRETEQIIANFAKAAASVKEVGFDFVEVHGSHGTLPCQFFSPLDNHRGDKYGGNLAGRMRFGIECATEMRAAAGHDFPLFFRIPTIDGRAGGITLEDSTAYAVELERAGVDCFDVSVGTSTGPYWAYCSPGRKAPLGTFAHLAKAIKEVVRVPVIAVGRNNTPEVAEAILSEEKADLIGIGRQFIADPMWPKKVMEGRAQEIVACDSCNKNCWINTRYVRLPAGAPLCKVNPQAGKEWEASSQQDNTDIAARS